MDPISIAGNGELESARLGVVSTYRISEHNNLGGGEKIRSRLIKK